MPYDIGPKIGIDGEKEFKDALKGINSQIKELASEMDASVTSMAGFEDAETNAAKKADILGRQVDANKQKLNLLSEQYNRAKDRLSQLGKELDDAKADFGENSDEALKAQRAYNKQVSAVNDLGTQINKTTAQINRMTNVMEDAGDASNGLGTSLMNSFSSGAIYSGVMKLVEGMFNLVESTKEYQKILGTLEVSSQQAGYTTEETAEAFELLGGVLGDTQQAATTVANLQAIGLEQKDLMKITNGVIGAWSKYGDSIPIDGLAEAVNETIKAGKVTGTFADVLNWAGTTMEDEFNAKLAAATTEAERANIVMEEFAAQGLTDAAEAWKTNNAAIFEAEKAEMRIQGLLAEFGEFFTPWATTLKNGIGSILETLLAGVQVAETEGLGAFFQTMADKLAEALPQLVEDGVEIAAAFLSGLLSSLPNVINAAGQIIFTLAKGIAQALPGLISEAVKAGKNIVEGLVDGIYDKATWVKNKIKTFCSNALGAIKDFFGIKSPSRVMRDEVGKQLTAGMATGITAGTKDVIKSLNTLNGKVLANQSGAYGAFTLATGNVTGAKANGFITRASDVATNSALYNATSAAINNSVAGSSGPVTIQIVLDKRVIAETVYDPLKSVATQRGEAFG